MENWSSSVPGMNHSELFETFRGEEYKNILICEDEQKCRVFLRTWVTDFSELRLMSCEEFCRCLTVSDVRSGVHLSVLAHMRSGSGLPGQTGGEDTQQGARQNRWEDLSVSSASAITAVCFREVCVFVPLVGEVIKLTDVKDFPFSLWLIFIICVAYYVAIFPFIGLGQWVVE